ncbi:MAG: DUF2306 domain-containing protein [Saprospiraceae bacterium]
MQNTTTLLGRFLLFILAFGVSIVSMRYWSFETIDILTMKTPEVLTNKIYQASFYSHVIFGPVALITGPFQFLPKLRIKYLFAHRIIGKIYVVACLLSGVAGLAAAQWTLGGPLTKLGFSLLAVYWLFTTTKAFLTIRKKEVLAHKQWMIRSYALTLSAVTLRMYLPLLQGGFGLTFLASYQIVGWLCWMPNLLVAEWWIRNKLSVK